MVRRLWLLSVFGAGVFTGSVSFAATLTVGLDGTADYADIQSALDSAKDGDTVLVKPGEYVIAEPVDFNRLHESWNPLGPPVKNLILRSETGPEATSIRMGQPIDRNRSMVVVFENGEAATTVVEGLTLTGGQVGYRESEELPGMYVVDGGGGVNCVGSSPTFRNCRIVGNSGAGAGGGVACSGGAPSFFDCLVSANGVVRFHFYNEFHDYREGYGGGIWASESSVLMVRCAISSNGASTGYGGGIGARDSSVVLVDCDISGNSAAGDEETYSSGGGKGGDGGGIHASGGELEVIECRISGNSAKYMDDLGGLVWGNGGGVWSDGASRIVDCEIASNLAGGQGAGICLTGGEVTRCRIASNTVAPESVDGGSRDPVGVGGGIWCQGAVVRECEVLGNSALQGGGIAVASGAVVNSVIARNVANEVPATQTGLGGGILVVGGSPDVFNCTICGNLASSGGGLYCVNSPPTLTNCIVWGNVPQSVCGDLFHCVVDRDPLFVNPAEADYHLAPGSPCVDGGTFEGAPTTDIDGNRRPCGEGVDIGAYEFGDCWPSKRFKRGEANGNGKLDISDPVATLGFLFLGTQALPCLDAADVNDSGTVDISDAVYGLGFLFLGGPAPLAPFGACGMDGTPDELDCLRFPPCAATP